MTPPPLKPAALPSHRTLWVCLLLAAVTLAVYWPVTGYEFVNYDDTDFITANPVIQAGVTAGGLHYAMQAEVARNWHPVTLVSHMLDCQIFGLRAGGHHLTSLLLHIANSLLLFLVLKRMTAAFWRSALVAALFAWHPLHVESVAWIAERKDVLSAFFWWLTLWAWLGYAAAMKNPGSKSKLFYVLAVFLYALAAMSKPMVVTLPFVLFLLDFWPLGRFQFPRPARARQGGPGQARSGPPAAKPAAGFPSPWRLLLEKIPFFAISAALCWKTFLVQKGGGAMLDAAHLPLASRLANAFVSYVRYPAKMFWPENLSPSISKSAAGRHGRWPARSFSSRASPAGLWPRPGRGPGWPWDGSGMWGCSCPSSAWCKSACKPWRTATPTSRWSACLLFWLGAALNWPPDSIRPSLSPAWPPPFPWRACLLLTARQVTCWKDSESLFTKMIDVSDQNYMAHFNLGNLYPRQGKTELALKQYSLALAAEPNYADAHNNLAGLLLGQQQYDQAIQHYQDAARLQTSATAYFNLANTFADAARARHDTNLFAQSVRAYQQSLQLDPGSFATHNNFGMAWQDQNQDNLAIAEFQAAVPSNRISKWAISTSPTPWRGWAGWMKPSRTTRNPPASIRPASNPLAARASVTPAREKWKTPPASSGA